MPMAQVDGGSLYYAENGAGPPLLLIHGTGANADTWGGLLDELSQTNRVIAYDRRGFSRSAGRPVRDYRRHAADAAALLKALGAAPATVIGWSSGGVVALDLAGSHPQLVQALLLIEPTLHGYRHPNISIVRTYVGIQARRLLGAETAAEHFYRWVFGYSTGGTAFDRFPDEWRGAMLANSRPTLSEFTPALHPGSGEYLSRRRLGGIACPIQYLGGQLSDPWFKGLRRAFAGILPEAEVQEVSGAGHAMHFDAPTAITSAVWRMSQR